MVAILPNLAGPTIITVVTESITLLLETPKLLATTNTSISDQLSNTMDILQANTLFVTDSLKEKM